MAKPDQNDRLFAHFGIIGQYARLKIWGQFVVKRPVRSANMNHTLSQFQANPSVRTYNLKAGPLLVKKRNAFMQFYQFRINALKSY